MVYEHASRFDESVAVQHFCVVHGGIPRAAGSSSNNPHCAVSCAIQSIQAIPRGKFQTTQVRHTKGRAGQVHSVGLSLIGVDDDLSFEGGSRFPLDTQ